MTAKQVLFRSAAREKLAGGVAVIRALENAGSVASVLMLTEATMTELPEKPKERAPAEMDVS